MYFALSCPYSSSDALFFSCFSLFYQNLKTLRNYLAAATRLQDTDAIPADETSKHRALQRNLVCKHSCCYPRVQSPSNLCATRHLRSRHLYRNSRLNLTILLSKQKLDSRTFISPQPLKTQTFVLIPATSFSEMYAVPAEQISRPSQALRTSVSKN